MGIKIFNKELNLFTEVSDNALLFLQIEPDGQNDEIFTLKNYNGEIIHFKAYPK